MLFKKSSDKVYIYFLFKKQNFLFKYRILYFCKVKFAIFKVGISCFQINISSSKVVFPSFKVDIFEFLKTNFYFTSTNLWFKKEIFFKLENIQLLNKKKIRLHIGISLLKCRKCTKAKFSSFKEKFYIFSSVVLICSLCYQWTNFTCLFVINYVWKNISKIKL